MSVLSVESIDNSVCMFLMLLLGVVPCTKLCALLLRKLGPMLMLQEGGVDVTAQLRKLNKEVRFYVLCQIIKWHNPATLS